MDTKDFKDKNNLLNKLRESKADKYQNDSRERLKNITTKKMTTIMVGSLDNIEKKLGFLWGHNKKHYDRDQTEQEFSEIWSELRSNILDLGNEQIENIVKELETYTIHWDRYTMEFKADETGLLRREK